MKKILLSFAFFYLLFATQGVFAFSDINNINPCPSGKEMSNISNKCLTYDQLCVEQYGPSKYKKVPNSLGGGAYCECNEGYDRDFGQKCLKAEVNNIEKTPVDDPNKLDNLDEFINLMESNRTNEQQNIANNSNTKLYLDSTDNEDLFINTDSYSNDWSQKALNQEHPFTKFLKGILWILFLGFICFLFWLYVYLPYEEKEPDRILKRKQIEEEIEWQKQLNKQEREELRAEGWKKHEELLSEIRRLPRYKTWRKEVFDKLGHICGHCGSLKNLEIHHIKGKSFSSIVKAYSITDTYQAVDCVGLWDTNIGSVLCKNCHDQMESSKQRKELEKYN